MEERIYAGLENEKELAGRMEAVGRHILLNARNELYLHMRFLDVALSSLEYRMETGIPTAAVDGNVIYYNPRYLGGEFQHDRKLVNRAYLHMVLHCLFCHVFEEPKEDATLWNLSCDIAMESILDGLQVRCVKTPVSWLRESTYRDLHGKLKVLTAEGIYRVLCGEGLKFAGTAGLPDAAGSQCGATEELQETGQRVTSGETDELHQEREAGRTGALEESGELNRGREAAEKVEPEAERQRRIQAEKRLQSLLKEFTVDDHRYWQRPDRQKKNEQQRDRWKDIREKMETELSSFSKEAAEGEGALRDQLRVANRESMDYRTFLRKFAVLREELQVDPDNFDYIFYSYGLSLYGNMPLIEPQETREVMKIEEFVIVIDTSMSCSGDLVRRFLEETYGILKEQESFFRKIHIRIIQCDEKVQSDVKIENGEALAEYMEHFELAGGGGTDFRPAFAYVEELCRKREFGQLRGLLYFTDGFGTYPRLRPPFQTAFVFAEEDAREREVPPWAMKVVLPQEDDPGRENPYRQKI